MHTDIGHLFVNSERIERNAYFLNCGEGNGNTVKKGWKDIAAVIQKKHNLDASKFSGERMRKRWTAICDDMRVWRVSLAFTKHVHCSNTTIDAESAEQESRRCHAHCADLEKKASSWS